MAQQQQQQPQAKRYNEELLDTLDTMANIRAKEGEPFKARAFKTAHDNLLVADKDIYSINDLKGIAGFGPSVLAICKEYMENGGKVAVIEAMRSHPATVFADIYGVGPKHAAKLVAAGITSIAQLRAAFTANPGLLNDKQALGLKYYEDLLMRIPRATVAAYETAIRTALPSGAKMEVVGSYRRGVASSGDIDIIFGLREGEGEGGSGAEGGATLFDKFIKAVVARGIVQPDHILAYGESKCLVIAKIPGDTAYRRIDFLYAPTDEYAASTLYFTGSKYFNTVMRQWAVNHNLTMNEHGIYHLIAGSNGGSKGARVDNMFPNEETIFSYLGLIYKEPRDRRDGRDVVPAESIVTHMRQNGIAAINASDRWGLIRAAKYAYYNLGAAIMTDQEYDALEGFGGSGGRGQETGAPVTKDTIILPYLAPSLDKIKPDTNAIDKWKRTYGGPYVVSCKLDGCSILIWRERKERGARDDKVIMATRGDGREGQDVSYLISHLRPSIRAAVGRLSAGTCLRGELIIRRTVFEEKYATKFANIRNMIAGILNRKSVDPAMLLDVDLVMYEAISPIMKPSAQMAFLREGGWDCVWYTIVPNINNDGLSRLLVDKRDGYEYEIDGLVVVDDAIHSRNNSDKDANPTYAFAFKMVLEDQQAEVIVTGVEWAPSKDGFLKPTVYYEPVVLRGATCRSATALNAAFVKKSGLGVGAVISIIRSGDVIPKVVGVVRNAVVVAMPSAEEFGAFHWNATGVDLVLDNPIDNTDVVVRQLMRFFVTLKVPALAEGNLVRVVEAGFNTVPRILAMSRADWLTVRGIKDRMADKFYLGIREAVQKASLVDLMVASNLFGRGFSDRKIGAIISAYPRVLVDYAGGCGKDAVIARLIAVPGIGEKSAVVFADGIAPFLELIRAAGLSDKLLINTGAAAAAAAVGPTGIQVVFSGFRDEAIKRACINSGIEVADNITKATTALVVKDLGEVTGKTDRAKERGIPIISLAQFKEKYLVE